MKSISYNPGSLAVQSTNALHRLKGHIRNYLSGKRIIPTPDKF